MSDEDRSGEPQPRVSKRAGLLGDVVDSVEEMRGANVVVLTRVDDESLVHRAPHRAWYFRRDEHGAPAGRHPTDAGSAIAQLEALRSGGARYLVVPHAAQPWLDVHPRLCLHLRRHYRVVPTNSEPIHVFDLRQSMATSGTVLSQFELVLADFEARFGRAPAILDCQSGLDLSDVQCAAAVFTSPGEGPTLPYLDDSIDVVVTRDGKDTATAEAHRVARAAVVKVREANLDVGWSSDAGVPIESTSIVIPVYNGPRHTEACLVALLETLRSESNVEVVLVDDASTDETAALLHRWASSDQRFRMVRNQTNRGFIASCNRGARLARGEILIFLNNDTVPLPGWLAPLLRTFRDHPDAGAVGGKLVYPDGLLQEAGGVIFSDGSAANFGKYDANVDDPIYSYVREVDYCSGAQLATRRSVFEEMNGFDVRYCPAYYEDVDYCFSLWHAGYRVYYQPDSLVVHLEGASEADRSTGHKQYQRVNAVKFAEKWGPALGQQPTRPMRFDIRAWHALAVRAPARDREP